MGIKMKAGIIGCGEIARGKHLPAIRKQGDIEVVAFCDSIVEKAKECRTLFDWPDAKVFTDYKELLKEDLDAVYVLTPNREHSFISVDALYAGKHVLCEKPMAKTAEEAQQMLLAAKETGKILTVGYQNRYRPDAAYLKKACMNGELGEIYVAKAHAIRRRATPTWGVFLNEEEQGGGPLIDIGTHALDLTLWMMDNYEPQMVLGSVYKKLGDQSETANAWGDVDPLKNTVEDSAFGFIKMKNGATIMLEASWALNTLDVKEARTTLCGTLAGADMNEGLRINKVKYNKQVTEKPELDATNIPYFDGTGEDEDIVEQQVFYRAVIEGEEPVVRPEQAYAVTRILEAIYKSAESGNPVYME
ncbi:MAG: Gfo/Idh/MocA family protein [Lachnospiraceae bacterium]